MQQSDVYIIQRYMKKNSSCRSIRTALTSPTHKPALVKKMTYIDPVSSRLQPNSKFDMPLSAKSHLEPIRKKMFSNAKLPNNQNLSRVNIAPVTPQTPLHESSKAYDQLKNKINNLEGRLVEIKKNFQLSFHKKNQKKRDHQGTRDKQRSKLVLTRNEDGQRTQQKPVQRQPSKGNDISRGKEGSMRRKTIQLKGEQGDEMLQDYVTTFTCQSPTALIQCTSEANLLKPKTIRQIKTSRYYIDALITAFSNSKPTSFDQLCKNHLTTSLEMLTYIKSTGKPLPPCPVPQKLPPTSKPTLIFDLDQTLIHCNEHATMPCDVQLPIHFPNGAIVKAGINIRPWARQCLEQLSKSFEIMVFTASHECYANVIIDYIDPKKVVAHRFFRDSCWKSEEGFYVKDLRIIDRDLKNVLLIDNAAYSYCFQLGNGVPVVPFYDNKADLQLKSFVSYAKSLGTAGNIRARNAAVMKLQDYAAMKETKDVLSRLYNWQN